MSHLPLDAQAILIYLNELGYWNISAEQLKEFMKGMLSQSEVSGNRKIKSNGDSQCHSSKPEFTKIKPNKHSCPPLPDQLQIKVIKSSTPLQNFHFYLDVCDHPTAKRIEEQIQVLGGLLEFLLTTNVTHFISDRTTAPSTAVVCVTNSPVCNLLNTRPGLQQHTPLAHTPNSPQGLYYCDGDPTTARNDNGAGTSSGKPPARASRQSRADAILSRARRQCNTASPATANVTSLGNVIAASTAKGCAVQLTAADCARQQHQQETKPISVKAELHSSKKNHDQQLLDTRVPPYIVWSTDYALRFFKKVHHQLKDYLSVAKAPCKLIASGPKTIAVEPITLRGGFIKIESLKHNHRPYYHRFKKPTEWPRIELIRDDGAFRLVPKKTIPELRDEQQPPVLNMTRKSRSRSSQCVKHQSPVPGCSLQQLRQHDVISDVAADNTIATNLLSGHQQQQPQAQQRTSNVIVGGGGTVTPAKESTEKQCGVCEICKIEYDTLTIHLKTKGHQYFVKNSQNFIALDTLIKASADVSKFLDKEKHLRARNPVAVVAMDLEEEAFDVPTAPAEQTDHIKVQYGSIQRSTRRRTSGLSCPRTPSSASITLREKSARTTKGKHSSEKFQSEQKLKTSPKSTLYQHSSSMQLPVVLRSPPFLSTTPSKTRNKQAQSALAPTLVSSTLSSPPIRAMLPPSSLYKVVETPEIQHAPNDRLNRNIGGDTGVGSPSLIVKFKKVRQTELLRLNGEAENFIFPKPRSSSDLPTDIDRQTTSENSRSGISLLSSSSSAINNTSPSSPTVKSETGIKPAKDCSETGRYVCTVEDTVAPSTATVDEREKRAGVVARRRKDTKSAAINQPSFPIAPIQPGIQLKRLRHAAVLAINDGNTTITEPDSLMVKAESANFDVNGGTGTIIALPEATRKSSRMATAIVTAATTSSRLLRAAVAAAKHNRRCRRIGVPANEITTVSMVVPSSSKSFEIRSSRAHTDTEESQELQRRTSYTTTGGSGRLPVVKKEDGMGDTHGAIKDESDNVHDDAKNVGKKDENRNNEKEADYRNFHDYNFKKYSPKQGNAKNLPTRSNNLDVNRKRTESQCVTLRRRKRKLDLSGPEKTCDGDEADDNDYTRIAATLFPTKSARVMCLREIRPQKDRACPKTRKDNNRHNATVSPKKQRSSGSPPQLFDITKSERLQQHRYAFERQPATDLWYRVFARQDNCNETYFEYYGSRCYRKLPYELGPVPFQNAQCSGDCQLCTIDTKVELPRRAVEKNDADSTTSIRTAGAAASAARRAANFDVQAKPENEDSNMTTSGTVKYTHKHKKIHLLQRYHEEQELLKQERVQSTQEFNNLAASDSISRSDIPAGTTTTAKFLSSRPTSKASTPERERSGSTYSTASSYASSSAMHYHKQHYRNKLLNLELPPRKSPREHASTLALVSCIIRQRQDSASKPGSETDEPSQHYSTDTPSSSMPAQSNMDTIEIVTHACLGNTATPLKSPHSDSARSPVNTPVEELRFTTEISENVKRMRRGQNKYDHSPPFPLPSSTTRHGRGRTQRSFVQHFCPAARNPALVIRASSRTPTTTIIERGTHADSVKPTKRTGCCKQKSVLLSPASSKPTTSLFGAAKSTALPSIRKTGSKKGVLEYEVNEKALQSLTAATQKTNVRQLELEIDRHLCLTGREYDWTTAASNDKSRPVITSPPTMSFAKQSQEPIVNRRATTKELHTHTKKTNDKFVRSRSVDDQVPQKPTPVNSPPPTDCFSSEFDLCDLFAQSPQPCGASNTAELPNHERWDVAKRTGFSLYNSMALQNYFRRRKNLKSNRTGWPKMQKKKTSLRQQQLDQQTIRFLPLTFANNANKERSRSGQEVVGNVPQNRKLSCCKVNNCGGGVITPPDSETEARSKALLMALEEADSDKVPAALDICHKFVRPGNDDKVARKNKASEIIGNNAKYTIGTGYSNAAAHDDYTSLNAESDNEPGALAGCVLEEDVSNIYAYSPAGKDSQSTVDEENSKMSEYEDEEGLGNDLQENEAIEDQAVADVGEDDDDEEPTEEEDLDVDTNIEAAIEFEKSPSAPATNIRNGRHISRTKPGNDKLSPLASRVSPTTSTPTVQLLRGLRRTPQLNGSLGSCVSPSEKAGDNSDIFTVSSDGLDTDLDMSNPHSQQQRLDDDSHENCANGMPHQTPKRKFDLSKYAPNSSSCASEAATAAVKSLAISQFLKKEVRVTCRRLRAPFRRFRYRR